MGKIPNSMYRLAKSRGIRIRILDAAAFAWAVLCEEISARQCDYIGHATKIYGIIHSS